MQEMDGVECLYQSTSTDCWTSQQTKGYMTATAHFINAQWQLRSRVLSTMLVEGSDTTHNLRSGMQKVFQAWNISEKVKTITSNSSPNVKAVVELLQGRLQPCFTHTLNLAVKDAIRNLEDVFATQNVTWRIILLCSTALCSRLISLNEELMTTESLLYAISTKQVGSTCMQCTIKDKMGPLYNVFT